MQLIFLIALMAFFLLTPLAITTMNLCSLFAKNPFWEGWADLATFTLGPLFLWILWGINDAPDWEQPIMIDASMWSNLHTPLASWHLPTILALAAWAIGGFALLRFFEKKPLPPLPAAACIAGIEVGIVLSCVFLVQLFPHFDFYMSLFPINYLLCVPRALRRTIQKQLARMEQAQPKNQAALLCQRILSHSLGWMLAGFLLALPLLAVLLCVLVLFGQAPDAVIRAFTETSDWALSQKISPPPVEYDGHYLCTVAVGGHPGLVRPLRYGWRRGRRIVVNRQLCVANAFEQLLMERTPRFHRAVRRFYDTHGYPLAQKLATPLRADIAYLVMKPLEWLFLLFLYTFDPKPEDRIALQYTQR